MGNVIRPELSSRNKYWIERHRYYELKHFCLQYHHWKTEYSKLSASCSQAKYAEVVLKTSGHSDPTARQAEARIYFSDRLTMVENAANLTDSFFASYILRAVTEELSYNILKTRYNIPCCKENYYELYRRFFWILSRVRD